MVNHSIKKKTENALSQTEKRSALTAFCLRVIRQGAPLEAPRCGWLSETRSRASAP